MCGIFGVVARDDASRDAKFLTRAVGTLARLSQNRGRDSSGLLVRAESDRAYRVFKGATPVTALLKDETLQSALRGAARRHQEHGEVFLACGHSRLVTNGSQLSDENNQPVEKDGILGIHNGIIVNDDELWTRHPELERCFGIDTEVFLSLTRKHLDAGRGLARAVATAESEAEGTLSVALVFLDRPEIVLATNNGSLYLMTVGDDLLFFASEQYPLAALARKMGLPTDGSRIRQVESGRGVIVTPATLSQRWFELGLEDGEPEPDAEEATRETEYATQVVPVGRADGQLELVRDVAHIARAPEASRRAAMLEYPEERVAALRRCSKCVLPETFPFIDYDDDGVCNYCRNYRLKNQPKPAADLLELLEPYRRTDGKPDCIVPFSGGRDSTYALHLIKEELGLNPIAFTYDWGMVTDLGRRNIARVCGHLGVENIIVAADIHWKRRNIRKNIDAWLRRPHLGMIPLFMAGDKYFYYYVDQVKRRTGINLNIWGINPMENTDFKVGFLGVPPDFEKKRIYSLSLGRQLKLFRAVGGAFLTNRGYVNSSVPDTLGSFLSRSVKPHRDYFHLFDYFQWNEREIDHLLFDRYDWERAIDTDTTWRIGDGTAAFYNYVYHTAAGFTEHDTFRSNQIREGMLSRDEALDLVREENRPRYPTIQWYLDVVGIDFERAIGVVNAIPRLYP